MQGLLLYRSIYFQSKYQTDLYTCVHPTEHTVQIDTFWLEDQTKVCLNRGAICNQSSDNFYPWHKSTIGTKKEFTFIDFQVGSRSSTRVSEASEKNYIVSRVGTGKMKGLTFRSIFKLLNPVCGQRCTQPVNRKLSLWFNQRVWDQTKSWFDGHIEVGFGWVGLE